jgi:hypothetical protein
MWEMKTIQVDCYKEVFLETKHKTLNPNNKREMNKKTTTKNKTMQT